MALFRFGLLPFSAGVVVGAAGHAAYPKLKEKYGAQVRDAVGPLVAAAVAGASDACAEAAKTVSERVADVQESMAQHTSRNGNSTASAKS
jgi:hypothetical protein